jgi:hypothetical protein
MWRFISPDASGTNPTCVHFLQLLSGFIRLLAHALLTSRHF